MTDDQVAKLARVMVVVLIGIVSLCLAIYTSTTLVSLLLIGYAGVSAILPGRAPGSLLETRHRGRSFHRHDCRSRDHHLSSC
jgi:Na+/proline symporter